MFLRKTLVKEHIASVHGSLWAQDTKKYSVSKCRLCNFEHPQSLADHFAEAHPRDNFATLDVDAELVENATVKRSSSLQRLRIRSDLFAKSGPSVQRSVSPANVSHRVKEERTSSPEVVFEKEVKMKKKDPKPKNKNEKRIKNKKNRSSSNSSSSSSTDTDSSEDRQRHRRRRRELGSAKEELKKKSKRWITNIEKYLSPEEDEKASPTSSPSPISKGKQKPVQPPSSPEYQAP